MKVYDQNQTARMRELLDNALEPQPFAGAYVLAPRAGVSTSYSANALIGSAR